MEVQSFAFFGNFAAGTLPLIFSIEIGVPEKEKFPVKDWKKTRLPLKFCVLNPQLCWGILTAMFWLKNMPKKAKDWTFKHYMHATFCTKPLCMAHIVYGIFQVNQGLLQDEGITNEKLKVEVVGVVSIVC